MNKDTDLRSDVLEALKWCAPATQRSGIDVIVKDGAVTLCGTARDWREKLMAERVAKDVEGVRVVANTIDIRSPADRLADEAVARPGRKARRRSVDSSTAHTPIEGSP